jgi:subtilisin family serine protease
MRVDSSLGVGFDRLMFDHETAARQRVALVELAGATSLRDRVVAHVLAERGQLADEVGGSSMRVAVDRIAHRNGVRSLIARGEILLCGSTAASAVALLGRLGYDVVSSVGPVSRLRRPGTSGAEVLATCDGLRTLGVRAGPNHVVAAGPVAKGVLGVAAPQPTTLDPGPRPAADGRGAGICVAVVDTGVDPVAVSADHGWLAGIAVEDGPDGNRDLLDSVPAPDGHLDDAAGHGTFVAGLVRQMAPSCQVLAVKALDSDGLGTEFSVAEALFRLFEADVAPQVVNLSLACVADEGLAPIAIDAALDGLAERHPDTVVVAAAGNDGTTVPAWPAAHKAVVAVGAGDGLRSATYSNRGYWVDYTVPADGIVSTYVRGTRPASTTDEGGVPRQFDGDYAAWTGTSFAAPQISGAIAALLSEGRDARAAIGELRQRSTPAGDAGRVFTSSAGPHAEGHRRAGDWR